MVRKASLAKAGKQWVKYKESAEKAISEGNYELSESVLFAALTEAQDNFDNTDFRYIFTLEKLGQSLWFLGRYEESTEYLQKLVDIHTDNSTTLESIAKLTYTINLALAHHAAKATDSAELIYNDAISQCIPIFGHNHGCTTKIRSLLADLLQSTGSVEKARALNVTPNALTSNDWLNVDTLKAIQKAAGANQDQGQVSLPPASSSEPTNRSFMPPPPPPMANMQSAAPAATQSQPQQAPFTPPTPTPTPTPTPAPAPTPAPVELETLPESSHPDIPVHSDADEIAVFLKKTEAESIYLSNNQTAESNLEKGDVEIAHYLYSINLKLLNYFDFDPSLRFETLSSLVKIKQKMGLADQAIEFAQEAHELKKEIKGGHSIEVAHSANDLAGIFYSAAKYDSAIELTKDCVEIYKQNHGEEHATIASSLHNLATLYHVQRKYAQAEDVYKECLDMKNKLFGAGHPSTSRLLKSYAELLKETHREEEAKHMSRMAVGMITGSWKPIADPEAEAKEKEPEVEHCEVCNADMEGQQLCPVCAYKKRKRGTTAFTDLP